MASRAMKTVGISAKIFSAEALESAAETAARLDQRGFQVAFDDTTTAALDGFGGSRRHRSFSKSELGPNSDLLITFGGDGTLLAVARHAPEHVPVIGVNMGTLGFLTEIRREDFPEVLERVLSGHFEAERRITLDVRVRGDAGDLQYRVLNDAVITKSGGGLARIVEMWVRVGGEFVSSFRADGLIVSTPMGSTAYNLSAGGPIIHPAARAVVLTPICPHMLTTRPVVLPDTLEIEIGMSEGKQEAFLTLDGQEGLPITSNDRVLVRKSDRTVTFVESPTKNYFDVLRNKLKWGEEPPQTRA